MATMGTMKRKPALATAIAVAVAAVAMLVIPFSYERTTGQDVRLTVSGGTLGADQAREIAKEFKGLLRADQVAVNVADEGGRTSFVFTARVPMASGVHASAAARVFEAALTKAGFAATTVITPVRERVTGTVYAYARDRVIEISTDGKSAPALESEIRQRLAEAGVTDAQVSVTNPGNDPRQLKVEIQAKRLHDGTQATPPGEAVMPEVVLTRNGAPVSGNEFSVRLEHLKGADGLTLTARVHQGDKNGVAEVQGADAMSDAALGSAIESQLTAAGLSVTVRVTAGHVEIEPRRAPSALSGGTRVAPGDIVLRGDVVPATPSPPERLPST